MNTSLSTSVAQQSVTSRPLQSRPVSYRPAPTEHDGPEKTDHKQPLERVGQAAKRAHRRIKGVIQEDQLSTRQSQALDKVQMRFDRMTKRLQQAVSEGGADRSGLHEGLDIVYGKLRDSLGDILANGKHAPSGKRHPEELTGLTLNKIV